MGRLTLNPIKHLDPFGLIMILIIGFGWAKPVPINPRNFKNPKAGMAISAIAGPVSNLLMALAGFIVLNIAWLTVLNNLADTSRILVTENFSTVILNAAFIGRDYLISPETFNLPVGFFSGFNSVNISALTFFGTFAQLNIFFAVFNLIPIPPLDGSRIVNYFLPPKLSYYYSYIERYGFIVLMLLMYTGILRTPLVYLSIWISTGINLVLSPIFGLFL
jgi:Zn-dependent protease